MSYDDDYDDEADYDYVVYYFPRESDADKFYEKVEERTRYASIDKDYNTVTIRYHKIRGYNREWWNQIARDYGWRPDEER